MSSQLRNTNKCIVNAMSCLAVGLEALSANLSDSLASIPAMVGAAFDTQPPPEVSSGGDNQPDFDEVESDKGDDGGQQQVKQMMCQHRQTLFYFNFSEIKLHLVRSHDAELVRRRQYFVLKNSNLSILVLY